MNKHPGIYKLKYKDRNTGEMKEGKYFWISYCKGRKLFRESSESEKIGDAQRLLAQRKGAIVEGRPFNSKAEKLLVDRLFDLVVQDYRMNGRKTLLDVESQLRLHINPHFSGWRAMSIRTSDIETFKAKRLEQGARRAKVNRELSVISRAFSLGLEQDLIVSKPCRIKKYREDNARQGFVNESQLRTLLKHLPDVIAAPVEMGFETGWRMPSEVLTREWRNIDFDANVIVLERGETKNGKGRVFPITDRLAEILQKQKELTQKVQRDRGIICRFVFHDEGRALVLPKNVRGQYKLTWYFRRSWKKAIEAAGLSGLIVHDLRRSGVRNFERSGIPRNIGKKLSGHLTDSIYNRYDITSQADMEFAAEKLDAFRETNLKEAKEKQTTEANVV